METENPETTMLIPELPKKPSPKFHRATVSFTQSDLERLEELKSALEFPGNAQTLSMAIKLAAEIVKQQGRGGKIIFENDGEQKEMIIVGLTKK